MTTTTTNPTAKPMLPTSSAAPAASRPNRHCCPRPPRRGGLAASVAAAVALLLASSAWLSLVFSSLSPLPWHRLRSWDTSSFSSSSSAAAPFLSPNSPSPPPHDSTARASSPGSPSLEDDSAAPLSLRHVVFGIAGSAQLWPRRREFLRLWWRPGAMRGHVWLDDRVPRPRNASLARDLPPVRVSEDISRFRYTNPTGHPSGLRISRIVAESFRLGHRGARWFVLVDDDTIFCPDNLVAVLGKYDWTEMVYIGAPSESHSANTYFSHSMAFGGGGIAISYPLAKALTRMQDECLERYPRLYGSDDRLHACISELGVPLTREFGFHQWDIRGNPHGLLAAHPIAPFISIHHVEAADPIYPGLSLLESLKLFTKAMKTDPQSFLQRAISYDRRKKLTFSVSLGYVVQVFPSIILPRELERSEQTYVAWNRIGDRNEFDFDTRDVYRSVCKKPVLFFLNDIRKDENITMGSYLRAKGRDDLKRRVFCFPQSPPLHDVDEIQVLGNPLSQNWHLVPRRLCCKVAQKSNGTLRIIVKQCEQGTFGSAADSL
ncbi:uncharacterized protein LOC103722050 [Phoenix dactylifera]|uniref:Uncharacterized protein LOC103722050 n=1 Tax=Phoenix dactylifera TaxID=42345 RepID=A0A8B9A791_PHODC|nr:uncharacterized protein LOC103722050 [Phoenix dactylifera]XP_038982521.1 uncharacterized protein LOC103722050 [Phoenix dactylifera]